MPEKTKPPSRREPPGKHKPPVRKPIPWFKIGWGLLVGLVIISLSVWFYLFWFDLQEYCARSPQFQGVKIGLTGPAFLPVGDDAEFVVTAINERSTPAELSLDLRYAGASLCSAAAGESPRVSFGPVQPGERASRKITVLFPLCLEGVVSQNWPGRQVEFEVWLAVDAQPPERIDAVALPVAPLPKAKTLGKWASGWLAGLALWTGKELWEQIKKTAQHPLPRARSTT